LLIAFDCLGFAEAARERIVLPALPWQLATASTAQHSCHQLMGALIEHVYVEGLCEMFMFMFMFD